MKNLLFKFLVLIAAVSFAFSAYADGDEEETLTRLGAGFSHSAIVQPDGSLLMWGDGRDGQLGIDSYQELLPKLILKNVKYVALGYGASAIIKNDGTLWTTGLNGEGQLGDGTKTNRSKFTKIMDDVSFVTLGRYHGLAVKKDGSLWAWGDNIHGTFCNGTTTSSLTPVKVMDSGVKYVHAGRVHTAIVKTDGRVFMCGSNEWSQLGIGHATSSPEEIVFMDETNPEHPRRIPIRQVAPGDQSTIFLLEDDTLWFTGFDFHGDACLGEDFNLSTRPVKVTDNVKFARKGWDLTSFVTNDNKLFMCGYNSVGELGVGKNNYSGDNTPQATHIGPVLDVLTGANHSLAITLDGSLYCWGGNGSGECGLGYASSQYVDHIFIPTQVKLPIAVPEGKTLAFNGKKQVGVEPGIGYSITGNTGKKVGNYKATAKLAKDYTWSDGTKTNKKIAWKIVKGENTLEASGKTAEVKFKKLKNGDIFIAKKRVFTVKKPIGVVSYKKASGNKNILVEPSAGTVKVGKGLKKGTYTIKAKVKAAGNANYKAKTQAVNIVIVVK